MGGSSTLRRAQANAFVALPWTERLSVRPEPSGLVAGTGMSVSRRSLDEPEQQDDQDEHDEKSNDAHDLDLPSSVQFAAKGAAPHMAALGECPAVHCSCACISDLRT